MDKEKIKQTISEKLPEVLPKVIKWIITHVLMFIFGFHMPMWVTAVKAEKAVKSFKDGKKNAEPEIIETADTVEVIDEDDTADAVEMINEPETVTEMRRRPRSTLRERRQERIARRRL